MRFAYRSTVVQHIIQLFRVQLFDPFSDNYGRDAVTHQVGQRARLGHKAVDAKNERQTGDRQVPDGGNRRRKDDKAATRHPRRAF